MKLAMFIVMTILIQSINLGLAERSLQKGRVHMLATIMSWSYVVYAIAMGWEYVIAFVAVTLWSGYRYTRTKQLEAEYLSLISTKEADHEDHDPDEQGFQDPGLQPGNGQSEGRPQEHGPLQ